MTKITRTELEAAFPWARSLPDESVRQFMATIDNYHTAAEIYARKDKPAA